MYKFLKVNRFFKSCLLASLGLAVFAFTVSFTTSGRAVAQRVKEDCIRICDTASSPLHVIVQGITRVTGDVKINNEDPIATTVSGPVHVATSPREPLYVIERLKGENIFQQQVSLTLVKGVHIEKQQFVVPAGKFLEIKFASGTATVNTSPAALIEHTDFNVSINVIQPNSNVFTFPLMKQVQAISSEDNVATGIYQVGGNQVGIFGDSGGIVQVVLKRAANWGSLNAEVQVDLAISGKYHDF